MLELGPKYAKFGVYWVIEWDFRVSQICPKISKMPKKELFWDPPKIPPNDPTTPHIFHVGTF